MHRRTRWLLAVLAAACLLVPTSSFAHPSLRTGRYECWLSAIGQYSNYDLKIRSGGRYVFLLGDEVVGAPGRFVHEGERLRFTSGRLKRMRFRALHLADDDPYNTHIIYLYRNGELVYDCNNN
jgi:hypothetical protein